MRTSSRKWTARRSRPLAAVLLVAAMLVHAGAIAATARATAPATATATATDKTATLSPGTAVATPA